MPRGAFRRAPHFTWVASHVFPAARFQRELSNYIESMPELRCGSHQDRGWGAAEADDQGAERDLPGRLSLLYSPGGAVGWQGARDVDGHSCRTASTLIFDAEAPTGTVVEVLCQAP